MPTTSPPDHESPTVEPPEGRRYWRTLEALAETPEARALIAREFPSQADKWDDEPSRRAFLKVMGASLALAGLQGCAGQPEEKIVPYVRTPEDTVPGKATYYATAATIDGVATGVLATSHDGRPTKVDGNPDHPGSLGTSGALLQAEILNLYDPDRAQAVNTGGTLASWPEFIADLQTVLGEQKAKNGSGLRVVSCPTSSPTLSAQREKFLELFPEAKWVEYSPIGRKNVRDGLERAFGKPLEPRYDLARADVVLTLDADPFTTMPDHLVMTRGHSRRRRDDVGDEPWMTRTYAVETTFTLFGASADHRRALGPDGLLSFAKAVAKEVGVEVEPDAALPEGVTSEFVSAVAEDLLRYRRPEEPGGAVVVAGDTQPPEVHALAHAMNVAIGAVGTTVDYVAPTTDEGGFEALARLCDEMQGGYVDAVMVLSANPVYDAPPDVGFLEAFEKVGWRAGYGLYEDETSVVCNWHLPATHFLEEWSDTRSLDGTVSIVQPLIKPLYDGRSLHELFSAIVDEAPQSGYDVVRAHWRGLLDGDFETAWPTAVHRGVVPDTAFEPVEVSLVEGALATDPEPVEDGEYTVVIRPDPQTLDGRFANNGWLQELPRPMTTLTWDNAALLAPADADDLGVQIGDLVSIEVDGESVELPAMRLPGLPRGTVTLHLGFGRVRAGRVGTGVGKSVTPLRSIDRPWFVGGATVAKTKGNRKLALTQSHHLIDVEQNPEFVNASLEHRNVVREGTLAELVEHPDDPHFMHVHHHDHNSWRDKQAKGEKGDGHEKGGEHGKGDDHHHGHHHEEAPSFYPIEKPEDYEPHEWGMQIDLTRCIGCNACTVACQSENNIPVVGREQVLVGREMHWIRVDTYYEGSSDDPNVVHQPVPCMHCEHAPCEPVCPVAATTHSDEGLNEMTYNRCVGTRYCGNNCPYKVRRFNFLEYNESYLNELPVLDLLPNPNVTVRSRGVMEKCTYCVQRISAARIDAQVKGDGVIPDGGVVTACQQSCPAEAIVFGNIADPESAVSKAKKSALDYGLLDELNTRPRTTYAALVRNPNPTLAEEEGHHEAHGKEASGVHH